MTQANRFNGSLSQYDYDNADRLARLVHSSGGQMLADYQYTLDANGNRVKALVTEPQAPEQLSNKSLHFNYNANKNRLIRVQLPGANNFADYSYDNEGQLKAWGTYTNVADYDPNRRPRYITERINQINHPNTFDYAHRLTSQDNSSYIYDGVGNRLQATRNGVVTKYIYDASGNLLAEANAGNQITRYYIYGKGLTAMVDAASNQLYVYHFDGTGHTVAITNANRQTVNSYAYDPYGKLVGQTESITQPFKYAGQVGIQAEGNNLYYMRARYYDANVGRFISEDPIGFQGGLNLYAYVGGNPVMLVDPSGLAASEGGAALQLAANTQPGGVCDGVMSFCGGGSGGGGGGIYQFQSTSGKTYVGQSGNIVQRIEQHINSGKLSTGTPVQTTEVLGGKTAREVAEQLRINELGGIQNLENIRNPIGPNRQNLLPSNQP